MPIGNHPSRNVRSRGARQPVTRTATLVLCLFAGVFGVATVARASCLPLPTVTLSNLDAQTETQPEEAIRDAQARIASASGQPNAPLRAQLFAILADAYTELSQPDQAHAAIKSARALLQGITPSPDIRRLAIRLDLLDNQLLIVGSNSRLAVTKTGKLLAGIEGDSLERACALSVRAIAYDYLHQPDLAVGDALIAYRIAREGQWRNAILETAGTLARVFGGAGLYPQAEQMINVVIDIAREEHKTALLSTAEFEQGMLLVNARRFSEARAALERSKEHAIEIGDRFAGAAANANMCWAAVREGDLDAAERFCAGGDEELASGQRDDLAIQLIGNRAILDLERHRWTAALEKLNKVLTPALHDLLPGAESQFYWERSRALRALHRVVEANADLVRMHELEEAVDGAQRNRQVAVLSALIASDELAAENRKLRERAEAREREATQRRDRRTTVSIAALLIIVLLCYLLTISRRHSRALRDQESILRSAGQNAPDAFLLFDASRRVRFANRNLCGDGPVPAIGELVTASIPHSLVATLTAAIDEASERRVVVSFTATVTEGDAARRQLELCVVPAVEHKRVVGGTLRVVDVTEHQALERHVIDAASQERLRLSSELHEGVGQQLAGVLLLLGSASNSVRRGLPKSGELIEEIARYVKECIDMMREIAREIAPVKIGMGSLVIALQSLVRDAARRLRIEVDCDCRLGRIVLSDLAADHLYSICREAITNAALHGRSTRATIMVGIFDDNLTVTISDNGKGMPEDGHSSQGLGLKMMAYRMRLLGGECKITRPREGGTRVVATVPLNRVTAMDDPSPPEYDSV